MTQEFLTHFFGWMALVNGAILVLATSMLWLLRGPIMAMHSAITVVEPADLPVPYFKYLSNFKIAWIFINLVPYLVLRLAV